MTTCRPTRNLTPILWAAAAVAFFTGARAAAAPAKPPKIAAALRSIAAGKTPCTQLTASYVDGNGFHGITEVRVAAQKVSVRHTGRGNRDEKRYAGPLSDDACRKLAAAVVAEKLWTVRSKRKSGVPDETRPTIRVDAAADAIHITLWAGEARDIKAFARVRGLLLDLASRVSGGKVTY